MLNKINSFNITYTYSAYPNVAYDPSSKRFIIIKYFFISSTFVAFTQRKLVKTFYYSKEL
jgi:hypothetical protein